MPAHLEGRSMCSYIESGWPRAPGWRNGAEWAALARPTKTTLERGLSSTKPLSNFVSGLADDGGVPSRQRVCSDSRSFVREGSLTLRQQKNGKSEAIDSPQAKNKKKRDSL